MVSHVFSHRFAKQRFFENDTKFPDDVFGVLAFDDTSGFSVLYDIRCPGVVCRQYTGFTCACLQDGVWKSLAMMGRMHKHVACGQQPLCFSGAQVSGDKYPGVEIALLDISTNVIGKISRSCKYEIDIVWKGPLHPYGCLQEVGYTL